MILLVTCISCCVKVLLNVIRTYVLEKEDQVMVHLEDTFTLKLRGDNAAVFIPFRMSGALLPSL